MPNYRIPPRSRHNIANENETTLFKMKTKKFVLAFGFLLVNSAAFISCSKDDNNPNPVSAAKLYTTSLSGRILNESGEGISAASVTAGGKTAITSNDGSFSINEISGNTKMDVSVSCPGFEETSKEISSAQNGFSNVEISMAAKADEHLPATCQLTINGDGFHNKTVQVGTIPTGSIGIFSPDGASTYFSMTSRTGYAIAGVFPKDGLNNSTEKTSMTFIAYGKTYVADSGVKISVSEYGEIGGKIKGTFSGTFKRYDVDMETGRNLEFSVKIINGSFEVTRQANL